MVTRFRGARSVLLLVTWLSAAPALDGQSAADQGVDRETVQVTGHVLDLSGAPVPGATVRAQAGRRVVAGTKTSKDGAFALGVPPGEINLAAAAPGLAPASLRVVAPAGQHLTGITLILGAGVFSESVTVAALTPDSAGTTASTSVVNREVINLIPGLALDDVLLMTPGFSLFRRSSSRLANPTAQGVSLRGLAASGASRALVLADGVPVNDPFGGWVYWNRLPRAAIDRVEVARGGWSDRYGADAVGGVVQILTARAVGSPDGRLLIEAGSRGTGRASLLAGMERGSWNFVGAVEGARSGRAKVVAARARGPIDVPAGSNHLSGMGAITWSGSSATASVRVNPFGEDRSNGTPEQRNETRSVQVAASASGTVGPNGWEVRGWGQDARFKQTFSIVSGDRTSETPTTTQQVGSEAFGARAQWNRLAGRGALVAGLEARQVRADNSERPALGSAPARTAGGRQRGPAVFARFGLPIGPSVLFEGGGRWETWVNKPSQAGGERRANSFSPRVSLVWRPASAVAVHGSAYRAFRAPTLNELYRGFRVGAISTLPNDALGPEKLSGAEGGLAFTRHRLSLRATGWWSLLDRPVVNVTTAPEQRQRQNVGEINARGLEAEVVVRPATVLEWTGVVSLTRSTFRDSLRPALDGRRVPQVPARQFSSRFRLIASPLLATLDVRHVGPQYEDDRNELALSASTLVDFVAGWSVNRQLEVRFGVENVANTETEVGRTPTPTIGMPRSLHLSVRIRTAR